MPPAPFCGWRGGQEQEGMFWEVVSHLPSPLKTSTSGEVYMTLQNCHSDNPLVPFQLMNLEKLERCGVLQINFKATSKALG